MTMLPGAKKDEQKISPDWQLVRGAIDGVHFHEVRHVPGDKSVITEMYRPEWDPTGLPLVQVYQSRLAPHVVAGWSCHAENVDRLFVSAGLLKFVLFDGREESPTYRTVTEYHLGEARPGLLVIPPGVWHGLENVGAAEALLVNMPSVSYNYADPDHYRLPLDTAQIPYSFR